MLLGGWGNILRGLAGLRPSRHRVPSGCLEPASRLRRASARSGEDLAETETLWVDLQPGCEMRRGYSITSFPSMPDSSTVSTGHLDAESPVLETGFTRPDVPR
jgi:hypothetical protein